MAIVHLIDDDDALRTACARLLGAAGFQVRSYGAAGDYLLPEPTDEPGCLLLDLHMPGFGGLDLQAALQRHPAYARPIVFMSGTADIQSSVRAMRGGACEFLLKPIDELVLIAAVSAAVERDTEARERRLRTEAARRRLEALGDRQRRVLDGILQGRLHKQIAAEIGVSERTIKIDRARVMSGLGVRNLPALMQLLAEAGDAAASNASTH